MLHRTYWSGEYSLRMFGGRNKQMPTLLPRSTILSIRNHRHLPKTTLAKEGNVRSSMTWRRQPVFSEPVQHTLEGYSSLGRPSRCFPLQPFGKPCGRRGIQAFSEMSPPREGFPAHRTPDIPPSASVLRVLPHLSFRDVPTRHTNVVGLLSLCPTRQ